MALRVREHYKNNPCAIYDPASGVHLVPDASRRYDADEAIVKAAPWYFIREGEDEAPPAESVRIADVEAATSNPGEKRTTRRNRGE